MYVQYIRYMYIYIYIYKCAQYIKVLSRKSDYMYVEIE